MNIYESVENHLNTIITEFKAEAKRAHRVAEEDCWLGPREMSLLAESNARALGAMQVKNIIVQTVAYSRSTATDDDTARKEALPRIIRAIQSQMDAALRNNENHIATVRVFNEVITAFRNEI